MADTLPRGECWADRIEEFCPPPTWEGRILKVPPKLAAGSRQNSQAGGLRYVAQPSRLRVRGASEPHVPSHRQPTDGGTIKMRPATHVRSEHLFGALS